VRAACSAPALLQPLALCIRRVREHDLATRFPGKQRVGVEEIDMHLWFRWFFWFTVFWVLLLILASHRVLQTLMVPSPGLETSSPSEYRSHTANFSWQAPVLASLFNEKPLAEYFQNISDLWRREQEQSFVGVIVFAKQQRLLCSIPKAGCTAARAFALRETLGVVLDPLDADEIHLIHPQGRANLTQLLHLQDEELLRVLSDPSWKFGALVRHPLTRLLSAYLDKVKAGRELERYPLKNRYPHSFERFVDYLEEAAKTMTPDLTPFDEHWRPQSGFCLFRMLPRTFFDCIGKVDEPESLRKFYMDMFGQAGLEWHESMRKRAQASGRNTLHSQSAASLLHKHVNERLAQRVRKLYAEDYERFGYDLWPPYYRKASATL